MALKMSIRHKKRDFDETTFEIQEVIIQRNPGSALLNVDIIVNIYVDTDKDELLISKPMRFSYQMTKENATWARYKAKLKNDPFFEDAIEL